MTTFDERFDDYLDEIHTAPVVKINANYVKHCLEIARELSDKFMYSDRSSDHIVQIAWMLLKMGEEK
jgi:phage gp36-like protein